MDISIDTFMHEFKIIIQISQVILYYTEILRYSIYPHYKEIEFLYYNEILRYTIYPFYKEIEWIFYTILRFLSILCTYSIKKLRSGPITNPLYKEIE